MKKQLVICCNNKEYEKRLREYVRKYYQEYFVVGNSLAEGDIFLIDETLYEEVKEKKDKTIFYLFSEKSEENDKIYRFQPAEKIVQELLFKSTGGLISENEKRSTRFIIFYTPGGNAVQSLAARQYAARLGTMEKILYVFYGTFAIPYEKEEKKFLEEEIDLSVLCYFIHSYGIDEITREKVISGTEQQENYQYLRFFHNPKHVAELKEEFYLLLHKISQLGMYDVILLDLAQLPMEIEQILRHTTELYSIVPEGESGRYSYQKRMKQWKAYIETATKGRVDIMIKEREYKPDCDYKGSIS